MTDLQELNEIKMKLLEAWGDAGQIGPPANVVSGIRLQTYPQARPPRPGLAIGHSFNARTGEPQLELRVTSSKGKKREEARRLQEVARAESLPSFLKIFSKPALPRPTVATPLIDGRRKPLHIGASIAHERGSAGTLGAFLRLDDGGTGVLSCVHVLAHTWSGAGALAGDPIQQPGDPDPIPQCNRIGELTGAFAPFVPRQKNNLDAAIARLRGDIDHIGNTIPAHMSVPSAMVGKPIGPPMQSEELTPAMLGKRVCKIGRTTGFTTATLNAVDFRNVTVGFEINGTNEPIVFSGVHEVRWDKDHPFTAFGDSGALVMLEDGLRPIGINFCAWSKGRGVDVSYVVPWSRIESLYGAKLL